MKPDDDEGDHDKRLMVDSRTTAEGGGVDEWRASPRGSRRSNSFSTRSASSTVKDEEPSLTTRAPRSPVSEEAANRALLQAARCVVVAQNISMDLFLCQNTSKRNSTALCSKQKTQPQRQP